MATNGKPGGGRHGAIKDRSQTKTHRMTVGQNGAQKRVDLLTKRRIKSPSREFGKKSSFHVRLYFGA